MLCPCGSEKNFSECCEPYITGKKNAPTAEALMRSRYSAHVNLAPAYLKATLAPEKRREYSEEESLKWARESEWLGLKIISVKQGQESDKKGVVEFVARYKFDGKIMEHHEISDFRRDPTDNRWYFVDAEAHTHEDGQGHDHHHHAPSAPVIRQGPKVGRNDPCPCGSGKKYKKCCEQNALA